MEHYLNDIFAHAFNAAEFVHHIIHSYRSDCCTIQGRQKNPAKGVTQRNTIPTFKRADDRSGFVLRVFNPSEEEARTRLAFAPEIRSVAETNLLESDRVTMATDGNHVVLTLNPFEVKTLKLDLSVPSAAAEDLIPEHELRIDALWPNPVSDQVNLEFELAAPSRLRIEVFDVLGRKVEKLFDGIERPGRRTLAWRPDAKLANGVYMISVEAGSGVRGVTRETKTVTVTR